MYLFSLNWTLIGFSYCSVFVALESYNMENIWKSSGVYKKLVALKCLWLGFLPAGGTCLTRSSHPLQKWALLWPGVKERKMKGCSTLFFPLSTVLHHLNVLFLKRQMFNGSINTGFFILAQIFFALSAETWWWYFVCITTQFKENKSPVPEVV